MRKRARSRTRSSLLDCWVAPSPAFAFPASPAARDSEAQGHCAQQLPPSCWCARLGRRGAHRHPLSISRACTAMTLGARDAQVIDRGRPQGEPSAMCRRVCISPGWSASSERARSMTTRWATTSTAPAAALWPTTTRSDSVNPTSAPWRVTRHAPPRCRGSSPRRRDRPSRRPFPPRGQRGRPPASPCRGLAKRGPKGWARSDTSQPSRSSFLGA